LLSNILIKIDGFSEIFKIAKLCQTFFCLVQEMDLKTDWSFAIQTSYSLLDEI